jgi:hypothetical protein
MPMSLFLLTSALAVAACGLLYFNRTKATVAELAGEWQVFAHNVQSKTSKQLIDTFPILVEEFDSLLMATIHEIEDEAASYACFLAHTLEKLDEHTVFTVHSDSFGTFEFQPDFENGHLVGVKLLHKVGPAAPNA